MRSESDPGETDEGAVEIDDRRVVPMTLLAQAGLSVVVAGIVWPWSGDVAAISVMLGGGVAVIPNAFLAARVLQPGAGSNARALMRSAWIGEIGKLLLTALLFGTIFAFVRPLSPPAVFAGFIAEQAGIFAAVLLGGRTRTTNTGVKS